MLVRRVSAHILILFAALAIIVLPTVPAAAEQPTRSEKSQRPLTEPYPALPVDIEGRALRMVILEDEEPASRTASSLEQQGWEPASLSLDLDMPDVNALAALPSSENDSGWTTMMSEDFEGAFPGSGWTVLDGNGSGTGGEVYWGKETYLHRSGLYSAWAAGGGEDGRDPAVSGYPNNMLAYMIYGPFNMGGALNAALTFSYWLDSGDEDKLGVMVSVDETGSNWSGWSRVGYSDGWQTVSFDLASSSGLQIANAPLVRIAFIFSSDSIDNSGKKGPFIDDVLLEKSFGPDITFTTPDLPENLWDGPIVASSLKNTFQISDPYDTNEDTYIHWAVLNQGSSTADTFMNCLYLEDQLVLCRDQNGLDSGGTATVENILLDIPPTPGLNTLKVVYDAGNTIAETDETNNVVEIDIEWVLPTDEPDLVPFTPSGWSYPIVPAPIPGTTTFFSLDAAMPVYIDWAIINLSQAPVTSDFEICLYLDAQPDPVNCWIVSQGLGAAQSLTQTDWLLSPALAAGQHTFSLVADPDNNISEANDDNNLWQRTFTWYPPDTCGIFTPQQSGFPIPIAQPQNSAASASDVVPAFLPNLKSGWMQLLSETFENSFPSGNGWVLKDQVANDGCQYLWGKDDSNPDPDSGGLMAGWPAGGGLNNLDPLSSLYPPNMDSWMIYGPFDLSTATGALDARLSFDLWREMETPHDYLFVGASSDGTTFTGVTFSGIIRAWRKIDVSLSTFVGQPRVWIAFRFVSDHSNQYAGPWIDNILLEQAGSKIYLPLIKR